MSDQPTNTPTARCPWCKVADVAVESMQCCDRVVTGVDEDNGPVYWAECQRCGAQGPIVGWAADAIPKWNESAPAPVAPGGVITDVVADLRSILLIEPDTEDEDDLLAEYRDCLATAKRLAKHALSTALSPDGKKPPTTPSTSEGEEHGEA